MKREIPSYLEMPPEQMPLSPPVTTREQVLPFGDLTWENFERLCLRLARREADVRECFLYGEHGQKQRGIDLIGYAGDISHRETRVYQCKRQKTFGPAELRDAVDKFFAGKWDPKPKLFTICSRLPLRSTDVQDELGTQRERLAKEGIDFGVWDAEGLSERLKTLPDLVDDFFDRHWVEAFNGPDGVSSLRVRLSGQDVITLRRRLHTLYLTLFNRHDPWLFEPHGRRVPYLERYVPPHISERRLASPGIKYPPTPEPSEKPTAEDLKPWEAPLQPGQPQPFRRDHPISQREFIAESREPALQWLPKGKRTVVLGEPGIGKSTLLRFVALSLLSSESCQHDLARAWGERLPIWISFAAWTRAISVDEAVSLEDFLFTWLHQHSADEVQPLLRQALRDQRLLLLIDGLDERYSEEAGNVGLDRLDAFLAGTDVPAVLTSRPAGYERIRRAAGEWRHGRLLDFDDQQIRTFVYFCFFCLASLGDAADRAAMTAADETARRETEEFLVELGLVPRLRDLARVPLLLALLVEVRRFKGQLPEHRIKAYDMMVEHLLTIHPALRKQAAGVARGGDESFRADDLKEMMAHLALRLQEAHGGGFAPTETCKAIFTAYLSDPSDGLGYARLDARAKANLLTQLVREGLGLLVEREFDELGFVHLTLQEYLAAWAIARKPEQEQDAIIEREWKNPRWREVVLSLIGIHGVIRRDRRRVDALIDHLRNQAQSELDRLRLWPLLSQTVFGDLGLSPARESSLAEEILDVTEQSPFESLRITLASLVVQGLRKERLREATSDRLKTWFPARHNFTRRDLLLATMGWEPADDLRKTLLVALNDEDAGCSIAAARALGKVFSGEIKLGERLMSYARRAVRPELREAALIALVTGWPSLEGLAGVLDASLTDRFPGVRLSAALGRIELGVHGERDFTVLWALGRRDAGLGYERRNEVISGILKGWPHSQEVKRACREILRRRGVPAHPLEETFDESDAAIILIEMFPGDDEVAKILAEDIQTNEFPLGSRKYEVWQFLAKNFRRHPDLTGAVRSHLERRRIKYPGIYPGPEEAHAIIVAGSSELRDQLIESFSRETGSIGTYWIAAALSEAWPDDEYVKEFLRRQLDSPVGIAAEVAPFITRLGVEPSEQRQRLLSIVRNPDAPRVWIAFSRLLEISHLPDEEVLEAGLMSLAKHRAGYEDESMKRLLIEAFPSDKRVEFLARELWETPDALPGFLASVYRSHPEFRPPFLRAMRPADRALRSEITKELGAGHVPSASVAPILKGYLYEHDPVIRTTAVVSLANQALHDEELERWLVGSLSSEITVLGMDYAGRRSAAVAGLLRLGRTDLIRDAVEHDGKPLVINEGLEPWRPNPSLIREILRGWNQLPEAFGERFYERFGTEHARFWEAAFPWLEEFPSLRADILRFLRTTAGKPPVGPNTLYAMARLFPRSDELRETCLEILRSSNQRTDVAQVAARLLGEHFQAEVETLDLLRSISSAPNESLYFGPITDWGRLLALCYGWPQEKEIRYWLNRPRQDWIRVRMPLHIGVHLDRISGEANRVLGDIDAILNQNADRAYLHDEETSRALCVWAADEANRLALLPLLDPSIPSQMATSVGLLSKAGPIGTDLQSCLEGLFEREMSGREGPPRGGLDLSVGHLCVVAESIFEMLEWRSRLPNIV